MLVKGREAVNLGLICVRPGAVHSQGAEEVPYSKVMRVMPREDCAKRGGIGCREVM
jgi:hypothetical protein